MLPTRRGLVAHPDRSERSCVLARAGMVCASVPAVAAAGVEMLRRGGNAVDAALATAAAMTVVEPMQNGLGGDAFALLWWAPERRLVGLNGSGRAPSGHTLEAFRERGMDRVGPEHGILSATVPGAVDAWHGLHERFGTLPFAELLEPAVRLAEEGFPVTEIVAHYWWGLARGGALRNEAARRDLAPGGHTPRAGEVFRLPNLARTLRAVAEGGRDAFYRGAPAKAIVAASEALGGGFTHEDLAGHRSTWVEPLAADYRGTRVAELPPNGQGLAALVGLQALARLDPE
ncbi:MAG: gamma-glutamyltransferase, partial [Myxococcota bacterium]|nr:gamma-glutamyltransferase [Myxococcota bacterium]